jgi:hypothetical protein
VIDPANGTVTRTIDSGSVGEQAQVSPDGRFIVG